VRHLETGAAPLREGGKGGGTKATLQAFFQAFPNLRLFSPNISKEIFGGFVGLQGSQTEEALSKSFRAIGLFYLRSSRTIGRSDPDAENLEPSLNFD
jgi:hypothetical protein